MKYEIVSDQNFQNDWGFSIMTNDTDLTHHGILGQKWGLRRFQRKDGSLTPAGKKRLNEKSGAPTLSGKERQAEQASDAAKRTSDAYSDKYQRDQKNQSVYSSASSAAQRLSNVATRSAQSERNKAKGRIDLSQISDSELRAMINRMDLEKRYREMSTETIGTGKRNLSDMLQTVGDVLAVGASAAAIIGAIHQYKSRK